MVIISTSATEVSIQAVSPELGVHFSSTAFLGSGSPAQAGGAASAAGAGAAAAAGWSPAGGAGCCGWAMLREMGMARGASGKMRAANVRRERTVIETPPCEPSATAGRDAPPGRRQGEIKNRASVLRVGLCEARTRNRRQQRYRRLFFDQLRDF